MLKTTTKKEAPANNGRRWQYVRYTVVGFATLAALSVVLQLMYPAGRLLPVTRINGEHYGGKTIWQTIEQLESRYKNATVQVKAGDKLHTQTFHQVGMSVRSSPTALQAGHYSFGRRLIPFSSVAIMIKRNVPINVRMDTERIRYFAEQVQKESSVPAMNAAITVKDGAVVLLPAKPSQDFPADATYQAIVRAPLQPHIRIAPKPVSTQPAIGNAAVQEILKNAQRIVNTPLVLRIGNTDIRVDKAVVAGWLDFPVREGKVELVIKSEAVREYTVGVQPQGYQAPTSTRVTVVDGQETARVIGMAGRGVDVGASVQQIEQHIRAAATNTLTLPTVALPGGLTYDRQYTPTSKGLTAYLADVVAGKGNYGIAIIELGGLGRVASANGDKVYVAASTYKLFIAYTAFKLNESGQLDWSEQIGGMRADACLEIMIVHSDNECSWAMAERIGWGTIQDYVRAQGLSSTTLGGGKYTTANDLALFLRKLEEGHLLPGPSRNLLIDYMKRQVYRNGIPAATGMMVANKVGGYGSYTHDAAIVYVPGKTYIMVIMSNGYGWPGLTSVAKQVHSFVNKP